jgi:hypothetical protein
MRQFDEFITVSFPFFDLDLSLWENSLGKFAHLGFRVLFDVKFTAAVGGFLIFEAETFRLEDICLIDAHLDRT